MNRFTTALTTRLQAVASAFVVTFAMLGAINGIATHEAAGAMAAVATGTTLEA
jgi:hypothetical protein